jgi:hypothetical protein
VRLSIVRELFTYVFSCKKTHVYTMLSNIMNYAGEVEGGLST